MHCCTASDRLQRGAVAATAGAEQAEHTVYAPKLTKDEAHINWQCPATELERRVRAFNPWPVCWTTLKGKSLRVWARARKIPAAMSSRRAPSGQQSAQGMEVATASRQPVAHRSAEPRAAVAWLPPTS